MRSSSLVKSAAAAAVIAFSATSAAAQQGPWTGLYLGAHAGYAFSSDTTPSIKGFAGGVHVGYNMQFSQIVAGLEGDYSFSNADASTAAGGLTATLGIDSFWSIRARIGFLATSNMLIYGTAGYGGIEMTAKLTNGAVTLTDSAGGRGFVAGGGLEYAFSRNLLGRVEGLYFMSEGKGNAAGVDLDATMIRAGLSYRF